MLIGLCRVCLCVRRSQNLLWLQTHRGVEMLDLDFTVTDEVRDCAQVNRNGAAPQVKARHLTTAAALALPVCTDTRRVRDARAAARRQQHLGGGAQQAGVHRADVQVRDPHDAHAASSQHALTNVFRCGRHRMLDTIHTFLNEFLRGFYDVVPMGLLSVFDVQEMELLSCGIEEIDVEDWKAHTIYQGVLRPHHRVVQWFWECVENFTQEQRSRLLQFVTGTSRVPVGGFSNLPGNEGKHINARCGSESQEADVSLSAALRCDGAGEVRWFTLYSIAMSDYAYPRAHTCFNRIDLPLYQTQQQLNRALHAVIQLEATGFSIE